MSKKIRTTNYSSEECWRLVDLVVKHQHVVENKKTDAVTWQEKTDAWQQIALSFNSGGTNPRTGEQLRNKFDSLKKDARKAATKARQQFLATGGGPCPEHKVNPLYEKIKEIIKLSSEGMPSRFDSDGLENPESNVMGGGQAVERDESTTVILYNEDSNGIVQLVNSELTEDTSAESLSLDVPVLFVGQGPSTEEVVSKNFTVSNQNAALAVKQNWRTYSPAMLQKPRHPALMSAIANRSTEVDGNGSKSYEDLKDEGQEPAKPKPRTTGKTSSWVTRRRPTLNSDVPPVSSHGKTLGSWADARKDLAVLQQELLRKEYAAKEKREGELHDQRSEISRLTIEKLNLEIAALKKAANSKE